MGNNEETIFYYDGRCAEQLAQKITKLREENRSKSTVIGPKDVGITNLELRYQYGNW